MGSPLRVVDVSGKAAQGHRGRTQVERPQSQWGGQEASTHMDRIGATSSRDAMRMPISQIQAVRSKAQVGSPLALPWPKT